MALLRLEEGSLQLGTRLAGLFLHHAHEISEAAGHGDHLPPVTLWP